MTSRKDLSVSERIAALQRGSSPQPQAGTRHTSPPATPPTLAASHSLKDKIAHFDALGSAPKPVGSFGLGVPVTAEHRTVSRELYGNRIPSANHKLGRSLSGGKELFQASSSTSSLDRDVLAHPSTDPAEASEGNHAVSPTSSIGQGIERLSATAVPEIRRTDSMTERWVGTLQLKPNVSLDTSVGSVLAPPSPVPDSDDLQTPVTGPTTPLTSTLIKHLATSSHVPSRLGAETPVSVLVETGSLVDGEQPKFVPEDDSVPTPSSPVVTGMQALGLSDNEQAGGETTPTREEDLPQALSEATGSLAPPAPRGDSPNTPLARSTEVEGSIAPVELSASVQTSGLGVLTGEPAQPHNSMLTATNVHQLDNLSRRISSGASGPSSVVVEAGSVAHSPSPSLALQELGAVTPEPASALTPKQGTSDLPPLAQGSVPLSAATLRLLELEGGKKGVLGLGGTETPVSILVETGSADGRLRDLEGVNPPTETPAPASPSTSYFEEPKSDVVVQLEQGVDRSEPEKTISSSSKIADSAPDNRANEQPPPVPPKDIPAITTNIRQPAGAAEPATAKTPTNKTFSTLPFTEATPKAASRTLRKASSRSDISTTSLQSAPSAPLAGTEMLAAPNAHLQRRATTGSKPPRTIQRGRVSRVPQMQLLPSGEWGVVGGDSDDEEEDVGGWAKVTVSKSRWS